MEPYEVAADVSPAFAALLACNRGPVPGDPDRRQAPNYGITAHLASSVLTATLTFRAGSTYCCCEWGCHVGLRAGRRWASLRHQLSVGGLIPAERLQLRLVVAVEPGALFFDWSRPDAVRRGWYAFAPTHGQRYEVAVVEG